MMKLVWGLMVDVFEVASIRFFRLHWERPRSFLAVVALALLMFSSALVFAEDKAPKGLSSCSAWMHMDRVAQHAWFEGFVVGLAAAFGFSGSNPRQMVPAIIPKGDFDDLRGIISRSCAVEPDGHAAMILFKHAGETRI